jgi:hypothetical protein
MPAEGRRLRVMHVILSRGFAGSERAVAEACAGLSGRHEVALVVRSDHRGPGGASIRDELAPGIEVFEVPPRFGTKQRLEQIIRAWAPDVVHTHLRRGTRYVARTGLANMGLPRSVHVATLHLSLNGPHYLETDGLFCISEWQLATIPPDYRGEVSLVPNSLVPHPRLQADRVRNCEPPSARARTISSSAPWVGWRTARASSCSSAHSSGRSCRARDW